MMKCLMTVAAVLGAAGVFADTLVWTGNGDGTKWSDAANWATTPDWDAHPASAAAQTKSPSSDASKIYDFDFTAAEDGAVLDNDCTKWVGSMTFGANKGTITVKRSYTGAPIQGKPNSTYTVPAGTTVVNQMPYSTYWGCTWGSYTQYFYSYSVTVTGGGEYRIEGAINGDYNTDAWTFDGVTVRCLVSFSSKGWSDQFTLKNGAKFYLDKTITIGWFASESTADELIFKDGTELRMRRPNGKTFAGKVSGSAKIRLAGGSKLNATGDWSAFTGTIQTDHGDMVLSAPAASAKLISADAGVLTLGGDTTVASITGAAATGGIAIDDGATLTVDTATDIDYGARLTGAGALVKDGAGRMTLSNDNRYEGTTRVKEGLLVLKSPVIDDGLYAYFPFDADVHDYSGNGRNLTGNVPDFVADGKRGKCAKINGGYLTLATPTCISNTHPFTVAAWVKTTEADANSTSASVFTHHYEWSSDEHGDITQYKNGPFVYIAAKGPNGPGSIGGMGDALNYPGGQGALGQVGQWHHIAITQTETQRKLYYDGVLKSTVTRPNGKASGNESQPWNVTAQGLGIGGTMHGCLDEVLVYSRALSADEITTIYRDVNIPMGEEIVKSQPQPIAHYAFDDETNLGKDTSGNGYDLTSHGSAPTATSGDGIYGKAWNKGSSQVYFELGGGLPDKFPRGNVSFTVQMRANFSSRNQNGASFFLGSTAATSGTSFQLGGGDSPVSFGWTLATGAEVGSITGSIQDFNQSDSNGTWAGDKYVTYTFVYDAEAKTMTSYRDGVVVRNDTKQTLTLPDEGGRFVLGCNPVSWTYDYLKYDDVQIFDCALTAAEVKESVRSIEKTPGTVLPSAASVTIDAGAELEVRDYHQSFASLGGAGTLYVPSGASATVAGLAAGAAPLQVKGSLTFAPTGVIDLGSATQATVAEFSDVSALVGTDNLQNWTVRKDGQVEAARIKLENGALKAKLRLGMVIILK